MKKNNCTSVLLYKNRIAPLEAVGLKNGIEAVDGGCVHRLRSIDHVPDAGEIELRLVIHCHELPGR